MLQREAVLFCNTKNGRVEDAESAPFLLPKRWTYDGLVNRVRVVRMQVARYNKLSVDSVKILQMYYKKKGKSKVVVAINGDEDIGALLREYPAPTSWLEGGKKSPEKTMYLAVDWMKKTQGIDDFKIQ